MSNESREQLRIRVSPETAVKTPEKPSVSKETGKKAAEILKTETAEAREGQEGVEISEGKVAEEISEDKRYAPYTGGGAGYSADQIEAIRAKLLAALPPQEIMVRQIKRKLFRDRKELAKKMKKAVGHADRKAFELTIIVAQLRKISEYFSLLAHATYELIKNLWLKIVHGV
ncbi:hypothetical protein HZC21_01005 [Candidatus Peregrinibacteria bacterium]|nr:hypothetical protein [Candidatus Peregrinibacteria bacterium]